MLNKISLIKRLKELTILAGCLFCLYLTNQILGVMCVIKYMTGISCLGCGMSRAFLSLFNGEFGMAFYYHPLFWMVPIAIAFFLIQDIFSVKVRKYIWAKIFILFLVVYLFRLFNGSEIVTLSLKDSFYYRLFLKLDIKYCYQFNTTGLHTITKIFK